MHRPRAVALAAVAVTANLTAAGTPPAIPAHPATSQSLVAPQPLPLPQSGEVVGMAWKADSTPLPQAQVLLRSADDGGEIGRATSDARGEFRFVSVPAGNYLVELRSARDRVLAVGDLFTVEEGKTARTFVRLRARAPWFSGFFGNAAAVAVAAASSLGITAVGSSGMPASPQ
jgi:hypothetical protein